MKKQIVISLKCALISRVEAVELIVRALRPPPDVEGPPLLTCEKPSEAELKQLHSYLVSPAAREMLDHEGDCRSDRLFYEKKLNEYIPEGVYLHKRAFAEFARDNGIEVVEQSDSLAVTPDRLPGGLESPSVLDNIQKRSSWCNSTKAKGVRQLDAEIEKAQESAIDRNNYLSVWPELKKLALDEEGQFTGNVETNPDRVEYKNSSTGEKVWFKKDGLRKRMYRRLNKSAK